MSTKIRQIDLCNVPPSLVRAVARQFGGWADLLESADDITRGGAGAGWSGFIYTRDTVKFAIKARASIAELAESMADDIGEGSAIELVQGFNCFRRDKPKSAAVARALYTGRRDDDSDDVRNALAWFALEEVARAIVDARESA